MFLDLKKKVAKKLKKNAASIAKLGSEKKIVTVGKRQSMKQVNNSSEKEKVRVGSVTHNGVSAKDLKDYKEMKESKELLLKETNKELSNDRFKQFNTVTKNLNNIHSFNIHVITQSVTNTNNYASNKKNKIK